MFNFRNYARKTQAPWCGQVLSANNVDGGNMESLKEPFKTWTGSLLALDVAGELYTHTRDWRTEMGQKALFFNPAHTDNELRINPLSEVRLETPHEISDAQTLASLLLEPALSLHRFGGANTDHWSLGACNILAMCILHVLCEYKFAYRCDERAPSLAYINYLLYKDAHEFLDKIKCDDCKYGCSQTALSFIQENIRVMYDMSNCELNSMMSSARTRLILFHDPIIAYNTSHSDIQISSLVSDKPFPFTLYLNLPRSQFGRLLPLYRLLFGLLFRCQEESGNHIPLLVVVPRKLKNWLSANMDNWVFQSIKPTISDDSE